jgi:ATP synthase protein I
VTTIPKPELLKATLGQLAALLGIVVMISMTDKLMAVSVLMGGLIQILPQAWFSWQAFKYAGANNVDKVVQSMYRGELGKGCNDGNTCSQYCLPSINSGITSHCLLLFL